MSNTIVTLGHLFKQDLEEAYLYPVFSTSHCKNSRFLNNQKYHLYDYPPWPVTLQETAYPQAHYSTAGDEIAILTDHPPPNFLKQHWETWLPVFPSPKFISIDDGLNDDIPIVTTGAFQGIPRSKHALDPDIMHYVQLKSSIPQIGVPCPRHMGESDIEFPCVVKVDLSRSGLGVFKANDRKELADIIEEIREKRGWKGKIVYQEMIQGIKEVPSYIYYLTKKGDIVWLGTNKALFHGFEWMAMTFDWNEQEEQKRLVYDEFVTPISEYLNKNCYFGLVNFELVVNEQGRFLVDLNARLPSELMHHLMAPYMASMGLTSSLNLYRLTKEPSLKTTERKLVEKANQLNQTQDGRVIILGGGSVGEDSYCIVSLFGKKKDDCDGLFQKLNE